MQFCSYVFKCVHDLFKYVPLCSNLFRCVQMSSKLVQNYFKCDSMCSNAFKCVQMCLNVLKTCSNVLVLAVISGYGWVLGGNGCFWVVTSDYECIWGEYVCFFGLQVVMVFFWVVFGWLRLVLGG